MGFGRVPWVGVMVERVYRWVWCRWLELYFHLNNPLGLCRQQQKKIEEAVELARDYGKIVVYTNSRGPNRLLATVNAEWGMYRACSQGQW